MRRGTCFRAADVKPSSAQLASAARISKLRASAVVKAEDDDEKPSVSALDRDLRRSKRARVKRAWASPLRVC